MSDKTRLDLLLSTEDDNGKKRYTKVGAAWVSTDRDGNPTVSIAIDAGVSISTPKNTFLNGYVPRERDGQQRPQQGRQQPRQQPSGGRGRYMPDPDPNNGAETDEIPF